MMGSSNDELIFSTAKSKLVEFRKLGYTKASLDQACKRIASETRCKVWHDVKK